MRGKVCSLQVTMQQSWDHPRLCGEKHPIFPPPFRDVGSPPPMRGKVHHGRGEHIMNRITPAYAGKRAQQPYIFRHRQDHPRLCGEKSKSLCNMLKMSGSPPPMRGKVVSGMPRDDNIGITPAYAGKRIRCRCTHASMRDHPRLCGEKRCHCPPEWHC